MADPVSSIRNLGPASNAAYGAAGIHSAEMLRALGPDEAYFRLLSSGSSRPHFIAYYALVMGLQGRPWNDCKGAEKKALRARFDQIKARHAKEGKSHPGLEAALEKIGVVPLPHPTNSSPEKK